MKKKPSYATSLSLACGLIVAALFKFGVFESLELKTLDFRFRNIPRAVQADTNVVIAAIDEKSLREFKHNNIVWKWPRDLYAALVRYFQRGGAKTIVFDILFSDPDVDRVNSEGAMTDSAFVRAMRNAGNVVLAAQLQDDESLVGSDNELVFKSKLDVTIRSERDQIGRYKNSVLPEEYFQEGAGAIGAANFSADSLDEICRRLPLFLRAGDVYFPQLGVAAYCVAKQAHTVTVRDRSVRIGDLDVPVGSDGDYLISWYGKGGPDGRFRYYSVGPLITSARDEELGRQAFVPSSSFKDKIVFVGASAAGLFDLKATPFTKYQPYPGMEISATVLSNLLQKDFLVRTSPIITLAAILLLASLVSCSFVFITRVRTVVVIAASATILWVILTMLLFSLANVWMDLVGPLASLVVSVAVGGVFSYQTEGKARLRLRNIFSRYVSAAVVTEILSNDQDPGLGGKEVTGTVFFSDIKDFTSISEKMSPRELVDLLNHYFTLATGVIHQNQGMLDKYLGDSMMALFGVPVRSNTHAVQACLAALKVQDILDRDPFLNSDGRPKLITRIGLNTGEMVVGNVGSHQRLDFTAMGDTVNLASRLEGVNKIYGTRIVIGEATLKESREMFLVRPLDNLRVKGKDTPVAIFELMCEREKATESQQILAQRFRQGTGFYKERQFGKALEVFTELLAGSPHDGPSQLYVDRCRAFLASPPPSDWSGVTTLQTK